MARGAVHPRVGRALQGGAIDVYQLVGQVVGLEEPNVVKESDGVVGEGIELVVVEARSTKPALKDAFPCGAERLSLDAEGVVKLASTFSRAPWRHKDTRVRFYWIEEVDGSFIYGAEDVFVAGVYRRQQLWI